MRSLSKSNILTTIESIKRTLKKNVEKIILKIWVQNIPSSVRVGSFLLCNRRVKGKKQAVKLLKFNIYFKQQAQNNTTESLDEPVPNT